MCGIAGIIARDPDCRPLMLAAERTQLHRGPDAQRIASYPAGDWQVWLGHQRLSIIDLSEAGTQPMASEDGSDILIYNGEVYNYKEIRQELLLQGVRFHTETDTEVVLAALRQWGPEAALSRFNGMWAFAWLDLSSKRLILARDRAGIKPLHFLMDEGRFLFASELKTVLAMCPKRFSINSQVAAAYLDQSLLDATDQTFLLGIDQVPAGHYCVLNLNASSLGPEMHRYWRLPFDEIPVTDEDELIERVRALFQDAVSLRLRSDVPVGVLLSGGLDSSSIAAMMRKNLGPSANLNLLSAVSRNAQYDESPFVDEMVRHLGCSIHKVNIDFEPEEAFRYLDEVSWFNDEPAGSFSTVAHYLLMRRAKALGITVILSGQGADELLCGYKKYLGFWIKYLAETGHYGQAIGTFAGFVKNGSIVNQFSLKEGKRYLPARFRPAEPGILGERLHAYQPEVIGLRPGMTVQERQALDVERFSVPVLTHYEDRMSMAFSREIRLPFLDYRMMELLVPLPVRMKLSRGWTKAIFRKAMAPELPREIAWRKDKQGFITPQSEWMRDRLKPQVLEYFGADSMIFKMGLADRRNLLEKYSQYCRQGWSGSVSVKDIFNPLALEIWLRRFAAHVA
ncbi:MAG: asparagine synthase (glutamine-hydrolyzing) [Solirubrobacterales bacterium]